MNISKKEIEQNQESVNEHRPDAPVVVTEQIRYTSTDNNDDGRGSKLWNPHF